MPKPKTQPKNDTLSHLPAQAKPEPQKRHAVVFPAATDAADFFVRIGVDLTAPVDDRADEAAAHMNRSQKHMLAAGVLLASIKAECEHGQFLDVLQARGFHERTAQRAMQYATFLMSRPEHEREQLMAWPSAKVAALGNASSVVIEALLEDDEADIDLLSARDLRQRIRDLEANLADTTVQRDAAEATAKGLQKKLARGLPDRQDALPHLVADLRAEIGANAKKGELAIDSLRAVALEVAQLIGGAADQYATPTLRLALAAACALRVQVDGLVRYLAEGLRDPADPEPPALAYLSREEVAELAQAHARLIALHEHERALREWERAQSRPRGKGRPTAKPVAPAAE